MTKVTVYCTNNINVGIKIFGHANDNAMEGEDIVCAGISALAINFINSVDKFTTDEEYSLGTDEVSGLIDFKFKGAIGSKAQLLLDSLVLGLVNLQEEYKDYILVDYKEV